jgi:hypothetical protein
LWSLAAGRGLGDGRASALAAGATGLSAIGSRLKPSRLNSRAAGAGAGLTTGAAGSGVSARISSNASDGLSNSSSEAEFCFARSAFLSACIKRLMIHWP